MPFDENVPPEPCVSAADTVTRAIEAMLKNDLKRIAVTDGVRMIGVIRLEDALRKIGLERDLGSQRNKTGVV